MKNTDFKMHKSYYVEMKSGRTPRVFLHKDQDKLVDYHNPRKVYPLKEAVRISSIVSDD